MKNCEKDICDCACDCDSTDDDYMLEKLYDMRNDIDFMIQVLEHRKEKEQAYQEILTCEDEEDEEEISFEELLRQVNKVLKPYPYYPYINHQYSHYFDPRRVRFYTLK